MAIEKTDQPAMIELPLDLQGYGIESGDPDYDRLDEHGKLDRFRRWQQENLRENPQVPDPEQENAIGQEIREQVSSIMLQTYFPASRRQPVVWN